MRGYELDELERRLDRAVTALETIANGMQQLVRIADVLDDVTDHGRLNVGGLLVTREDRP